MPSPQRNLFIEDLEHWNRIFSGGESPLTVWRAINLVWSHQPLQATAIFRLAQGLQDSGIPLLPGLLRRLNIMVNGLDIVPGIPVGGGLYMPHTVGTVVMATRVGRGVTLVSNVTIGMRNSVAFPTIGDNVYVGAGARVLGGITVGDSAVIGANAVVMSDVPTGALAVGVPARIISKRDAGAPEHVGPTAMDQGGS